MQVQHFEIPLRNVVLKGILNIPSSAKGLVVFVHGSGSSRVSIRNQKVANNLNQAGLATLLFDLLSSEEEGFDKITRELRFNIPLLANRLIEVTYWVKFNIELKALPIGYFGASTGASAAIIAATQCPRLSFLEVGVQIWRVSFCRNSKAPFYA